MTAELQDCLVCGGIVEPKLTTYFQVVHGKAYIINDVPAQECFQCGERYLSADTAYSLEQIMRDGTPAEFRQVPVYRFAPVERPDRPAAAKSRQNSA